MLFAECALRSLLKQQVFIISLSLQNCYNCHQIPFRIRLSIAGGMPQMSLKWNSRIRHWIALGILQITKLFWAIVWHPLRMPEITQLEKEVWIWSRLLIQAFWHQMQVSHLRVINKRISSTLFKNVIFAFTIEKLKITWTAWFCWREMFSSNLAKGAVAQDTQV